MPRRSSPLLVLLLTAAACTGTASSPPEATAPSREPVVSETPSATPSPAGNAIVLDVVADTGSGSGSPEIHRTYLDGMRTAVSQLNADGGVNGRPLALVLHDHGADLDEAERLIRDLAGQGATAILYVGPGLPVTALRPQLEEADVPLVLLEGDLYTSRGLFEEVFQTTIPWEWQANVLARYLVTDRGARDVVFVGTGPEAPAAERALRTALGYYGGRLAAAFTNEGGDPSSELARAFERAGRSDWTIVFGSALDAALLMNGIEEVRGPRPGIAGPPGLLVPQDDAPGPDTGSTVAPYTYTWSGWAEPIARVGTFRALVLEHAGRLPAGLEQEGYDGVRVLAEALEAAGGKTGPALVDAIEAMPARSFSGWPLDFGPDDHLFSPRDELGLFAVAGPKERLEPWMVRGTDLWRPVMRMFTYDGERTSVLDRDRRVFFPFWRKNQPGPEYWRSRHGITTKPSDPLH